MKKSYLFILVALFCKGVTAQSEPLNLENNIALEGYDVLSYFQGKPTKGISEYKTTHNEASYYFKNSENLAAFEENPEKYLPMYGGWCAYAMGDTGEFVEVDVETYKIVDGKLFLFYNAFFNNTLKKWNKNEAPLLKKADENWGNHLQN